MYGHFEYMYVCTTDVKCGTIWYQIKLIRKRVRIGFRVRHCLYTQFILSNHPKSCHV